MFFQAAIALTSSDIKSMGSNNNGILMVKEVCFLFLDSYFSSSFVRKSSNTCKNIIQMMYDLSTNSASKYINTFVKYFSEMRFID